MLSPGATVNCSLDHSPLIRLNTSTFADRTVSCWICVRVLAKKYSVFRGAFTSFQSVHGLSIVNCCDNSGVFATFHVPYSGFFSRTRILYRYVLPGCTVSSCAQTAISGILPV